jgi:hypothetical protein
MCFVCDTLCDLIVQSEMDYEDIISELARQQGIKPEQVSEFDIQFEIALMESVVEVFMGDNMACPEIK